jgi:hypothetical protein
MLLLLCLPAWAGGIVVGPSLHCQTFRHGLFLPGKTRLSSRSAPAANRRFLHIRDQDWGFSSVADHFALTIGAPPSGVAMRSTGTS